MTLSHNVSTEQEVDEIYADAVAARVSVTKEPQITSGVDIVGILSI